MGSLLDKYDKVGGVVVCSMNAVVTNAAMQHGGARSRLPCVCSYSILSSRRNSNIHSMGW